MSAHSFPDRLRAIRNERRLSKTALGKLVGVSTTCIWNWEKGNTEPRPENMLALSKALNAPLDFLESGRGVVVEGDKAAGGLARNLAEVIASAKSEIAKLAGIDLAKVTISLDY